MMNSSLYRVVDLGVFAAANLINLLLTVMFVARGRRNRKVESSTGLAVVALAVPLAAAAVLNALGRRAWWTWALPLLMVAFCVVEYLLDYALKVEFRDTRAMKPYLLLYYLALMSLIGYSFLVGKIYGYATLLTYFVHMGATAYSYGRVRHGR
jgi:polyferredoxin